MLSICSAVLVAASASPPPAGTVVEEQAFLAPVLESSPALRVAAEPLRRAEAALRRARTIANPFLVADREAPEDNPTQTTLVVAWTPPLDGRRGLALRAARASVEAARARTQAARVALSLELRQVFADWALGQARRDVLAGQAAGVRRLTEQVAAQARAGEESGLAARRLALAEAELTAELAHAEADLARARAVARAWRPDLDPSARPARPPLRPAEAGLAMPGLEALRLDVDQARFEERLSNRFWTFPELRVGLQRLSTAGPTLTGPVFGLSVAVPLFDRNQAGRLEAAARRDAAEARLSLETQRLEAQRAGAREAYAGLAAAARSAEVAATEGDRAVESATAAFRSGEATVTDLLDTLRSARAAQTRAIDIHAAALAAHRQLEALSAGVTGGGQR
jgi:outer membrane protein TolC